MLVGVDDVTSRSVGASETEKQEQKRGKRMTLVIIKEERIKLQDPTSKKHTKNSLVACVPVRG